MKKTYPLRLGLSRSVFTNRPLFTLCVVFIGAMATSFFLNRAAMTVLGICLIISLAVTLAAFLILRKRRKRKPSRLPMIMLCLILALLALVRLFLLFGVKYERYTDFASTTECCIIEGRITGCRYSSTNLSSYDILLDKIDADDDLKGVYAVFDCKYFADLEVGDEIRATVFPCSIYEYSSSFYDEKALISDGFMLAFTSFDSEELKVTGSADGMYFDLLRARSDFSRRLSTDDKESGGIAAALLLGDKSQLPREVARDFERTGMSHLLALSGLHVAVLFGIIDFLLRLFFIPKKVRMPIIGAAALLYLALIGFLPSAVRAVVMLMLAYAALAFAEDGDSVTALGLAGAIILAVSPSTVADLGFWMSLSATFGIVTLSPTAGDKLSRLLTSKKRRKRTLARRIFRRLLISLVNIISGLAVGVAACTFTLWAMAGGGYISLLSPALTLIMTPLAGLILLCAPLSLIFYSTPVRFILTSGTRLAAGAMTGITSHLSLSSEHIIPMTEKFVLPLCAITLFLAIAPLPMLRRGRPKGKNRYVFRMVIVLLIGIALLTALLSIHSLATKDDLDVTYFTPNTQTEYIVMQSGKSAVISEFSNGGNSSMSAALRIAEQNGATEIAAIMLTDYHSRTPGMLYKTFSGNLVRRLWLPEPTCEEDYYIMLSCIEKAELSKPPVEVSVYSYNDELSIFESGRISLHRSHIDRSVQPIFLMTIDTPSGQATYLHPTFTECETDFIDTVNGELKVTQNLIIGRHGPKVKNSFSLDELNPDVEQIIFASEDVAAFVEIPKNISYSSKMIVGGTKIKMRLAE